MRSFLRYVKDLNASVFLSFWPRWWRNDSHVGLWWLSSCYLLFKAGVKGGHTEYTLPILNQYSEDPASRVRANLMLVSPSEPLLVRRLPWHTPAPSGGIFGWFKDSQAARPSLTHKDDIGLVTFRHHSCWLCSGNDSSRWVSHQLTHCSALSPVKAFGVVDSGCLNAAKHCHWCFTSSTVFSVFSVCVAINGRWVGWMAMQCEEGTPCTSHLSSTERTVRITGTNALIRLMCEALCGIMNVSTSVKY